VVFFFGRRSARKLTKEDALVHLAKFDISSEAAGAPGAV
jgi:hypothetical protein